MKNGKVQSGRVAVLLVHTEGSELRGGSLLVHLHTCHDPYDPDRITGGSSGDSGASVAAKFAPAALLSDAFGSTRCPSHWRQMLTKTYLGNVLSTPAAASKLPRFEFHKSSKQAYFIERSRK
jgi:hypothetical protein